MIAAIVLLLQAASAAPPPPVAYPTDARVDYALGCMAANGETYEMVQRCSCSIDVIASIIPYDEYVKAATVLSMRGVTGERAALIAGAAVLRTSVQRLRQAQVEADFRCF